MTFELVLNFTFSLSSSGVSGCSFASRRCCCPEQERMPDVGSLSSGFRFPGACAERRRMMNERSPCGVGMWLGGGSRGEQGAKDCQRACCVGERCALPVGSEVIVDSFLHMSQFLWYSIVIVICCAQHLPFLFLLLCHVSYFIIYILS